MTQISKKPSWRQTVEAVFSWLGGWIFSHCAWPRPGSPSRAPGPLSGLWEEDHGEGGWGDFAARALRLRRSSGLWFSCQALEGQEARKKRGEPSLPGTRCQKPTCGPLAKAVHSVRADLAVVPASGEALCLEEGPRYPHPPACWVPLSLPGSTPLLSLGLIRKLALFLKEANLHLHLSFLKSTMQVETQKGCLENVQSRERKLTYWRTESKSKKIFLGWNNELKPRRLNVIGPWAEIQH